MINQYFSSFDKLINDLDFIVKIEIQKQELNNFLGIIEGRLYFKCGILDVLEVVKITDNQLSKKKYKYHFRNFGNIMIFRYDNAPHHQVVQTFPHHKHIADSIKESTEPDISEILSEIKKYERDSIM